MIHPSPTRIPNGVVIGDGRITDRSSISTSGRPSIEGPAEFANLDSNPLTQPFKRAFARESPEGTECFSILYLTGPTVIRVLSAWSCLKARPGLLERVPNRISGTSRVRLWPFFVPFSAGTLSTVPRMGLEWHFTALRNPSAVYPVQAPNPVQSPTGMRPRNHHCPALLSLVRSSVDRHQAVPARSEMT